MHLIRFSWLQWLTGVAWLHPGSWSTRQSLGASTCAPCGCVNVALPTTSFTFSSECFPHKIPPIWVYKTPFFESLIACHFMELTRRRASPGPFPPHSKVPLSLCLDASEDALHAPTPARRHGASPPGQHLLQLQGSSVEVKFTHHVGWCERLSLI